MVSCTHPGHQHLHLRTVARKHNRHIAVDLQHIRTSTHTHRKTQSAAARTHSPFGTLSTHLHHPRCEPDRALDILLQEARIHAGLPVPGHLLQLLLSFHRHRGVGAVAMT